MRILHENPEGCSAKRRILPFLCIAERVTGHGVNSNALACLPGSLLARIDMQHIVYDMYLKIV